MRTCSLPTSRSSRYSHRNEIRVDSYIFSKDYRIFVLMNSKRPVFRAYMGGRGIKAPIQSLTFDDLSDYEFDDSGFPDQNISLSPVKNCNANLNDGQTEEAKWKISCTPPHKNLRALHLYDTPQTPRSLLQKAQHHHRPCIRPILFAERQDRPKANVNPFTPQANAQRQSTPRDKICKKRPRLPSSGNECSDSLEGILDEDSQDSDIFHPSKKLALREINTSRYNEEFHEVCKLDDGAFGSVYKCINRLDGCTYAIKKSKMPVAGSVYERTAMNEVYAHAVLGKHQHVVRYYSAWAEKDHMFIQNEFCNGGSLEEMLVQRRRENDPLSENELKQILKQVAQGLRYIHSQNLVHLDIKPGNIFIQHDCMSDSSCEDDNVPYISEDVIDQYPITYKIGDLGHVTSVDRPQVEDGDCRYLPQEILSEDYSDLRKSDVFSLALSIIEAGFLSELPKNGEAWHCIREGQIPTLEHCSDEFNSLLMSMVHPDPVLRPCAVTLAQHTALNPFSVKTRAQLRRELNEEKFKNEVLSRELQEARQFLVKLPSNAGNVAPKRATRLTGGSKMLRSMSLTCF